MFGTFHIAQKALITAFPYIVKTVTILFYITTGLIAALTYKSAKKTVLQPMKTEILKRQIDVFSNIMELFVTKDEQALRTFFGFDKMILANAMLLFDQYADLFFGIKFDSDKRPYNKEACPSSIVTEDYIMKNYSLYSAATIYNPKSEPNEERNSQNKIDDWNNKEFGEVLIPKENTAALDTIRHLAKSPLLPKACIDHLQKIVKTVSENTNLINDTLKEISPELLDKYPSVETMKKASIVWVMNRYNRKFVDLSPSCSELIDYMRDYLRSDNLFN